MNDKTPFFTIVAAVCFAAFVGVVGGYSPSVQHERFVGVPSFIIHADWEGGTNEKVECAAFETITGYQCVADIFIAVGDGATQYAVGGVPQLSGILYDNRQAARNAITLIAMDFGIAIK